jgi:hypothetical protein
MSKLRTKNHASLQLISDKVQIIRFYLSLVRSVSCIRRKRGQIICLQGNNKSMVIFVLKRQSIERTGTISGHVYFINNLTYIIHVFKEALATILTNKLYVLEIGK